jgi:hypothetical protein
MDALDRTRTHGHGHDNGHGKVARDRKVGFAHRVRGAGRIGEVTEGSSRFYERARGSATKSAAIFDIL